MKCHQLFSSNFDMFAAAIGSQPMLEPIHYMEEKPLKINQNLRTSKRNLSTRKAIKNKTFSRKGKTAKLLKTSTPIGNIIKKELETSYNESVVEQDISKENINDPLFTPQMLVKCELIEGKSQADTKTDDEESDQLFHSDEDKDFCADDYAEDDDEDHKMRRRKKKVGRKSLKKASDDNNDDDDNDDEVLIRLQKRLARKGNKKAKIPRLKDCQDTCKHKCTNKFERQQRLDIYHFYWQLRQEDKINFIRAHVRRPVVKYLQANSMRCCYFLKIYKSADMDSTKQSEAIQTSTVQDNVFSPDDDQLTKVCRKFFTGTLKISDQEIKEAIKDFELIPERIKHHIKEAPKVDVNIQQKVTKMQYLDPETGDLTDTKPKKPNQRRKNNEPPPKRLPKPVKCAINCKFKCHEKFSEEERKQICDIFWSLDYQRRKDFVLSRIEIKDVKRRLNPEYRKTNGSTRSYQTKYYFRSGPKSENVRVCKHFMENTLNVHKCFIENAIEFSDKATGAYTGFDRRVQNNKIDADRLQAVLDHIGSYPFWQPNKKGKTKYLHHSLTIRKMYEAYKEKCLAKHMDVVSVNFYYKVFHKDFHIMFLANPHSEKGRGYFKSNPNISHYTGDEPGGCWFDSNGAVLDLCPINPATAADSRQNNLNSNISCFPKEWGTINAGADGFALNLVQNPLKSFTNQDLTSTIAAKSSEVISNDCYGHISADSIQLSE